MNSLSNSLQTQVASANDRLSLPQPDDWHLHLRDGDTLVSLVPHSAAQFARAIVMPNLKPPITTVAQAGSYRERILRALPEGHRFRPLMTLYLTDSLSPAEIRLARAGDIVHGVKLYPAGATTNSDSGVSRLEGIYPLLEVMEEVDLPLLVHAEVTDPEVDIFDREVSFLSRHLSPILNRFQGLRVVVEHLTTQDGVDFVLAASDRVAATLTAHHLLYNRNAMLVGGMRPHFYCLPVLKRESHRQALLKAATSGQPKFFLGTDSAPHPQIAKESPCGCAGCYTAFAALELYAEAFEQAGALHRLADFASGFGADFYRLPRNQRSVTLARIPWEVPECYPLGSDRVVPLRAGERLGWRLLEDVAE